MVHRGLELLKSAKILHQMTTLREHWRDCGLLRPNGGCLSDETSPVGYVSALCDIWLMRSTSRVVIEGIFSARTNSRHIPDKAFSLRSQSSCFNDLPDSLYGIRAHKRRLWAMLGPPEAHGRTGSPQIRQILPK